MKHSNRTIFVLIVHFSHTFERYMFSMRRSSYAWIINQRGSNFDKFFLVDEGRETKYHYKRAIIDPPANVIEWALRWHADDGPILNAG